MNLEQIIQITRFTPRRIRKPYAWVGHLPFAYHLVIQTRPRLIVELGTHSGNSYFCMCQAVKEASLNTICYAIDTWQGEQHAGNYSEDIFEDVNKYNTYNYSQFSYLIRNTFESAAPQFADGSIDILHIDGCHTYDAVTRDFELYYPKVAEGGLIMLHDITARHHKDFGVWRFWEKLKQESRLTCSFSHSWGLGVLIKRGFSDANDSTKDFLFGEHCKPYRELFTLVGNNLLNICELENQREESKLLTSTNIGLHQELETLRNSFSWRVTRPLRMTREAFGSIVSRF